ncbi:hypothetical protein OGAPHI_002638 [Ogataea philodendri]|uniref:Isopentenyl-diphosphate Delta-isomerase n=1 Tax=Ogataea philodendri TaxID=1378263 RepID=A0A9P8T784_9ASCO|nr:uncharacterized protein OGAPHI_002638 [Ogataea philodendri]KAH3668883.1 hypothetical protein OGAPHI_002638 [Ogataea philodendri]
MSNSGRPFTKDELSFQYWFDFSSTTGLKSCCIKDRISHEPPETPAIYEVDCNRPPRCPGSKDPGVRSSKASKIPAAVRNDLKEPPDRLMAMLGTYVSKKWGDISSISKRSKSSSRCCLASHLRPSIRGKLSLLLGSSNLVTHSIELVFLVVVLLLESWTSTLTLDPVVSRWSHLTVNNSPHFLSQVLGELGRVSNDDNTTLERLQGLRQSSKRVSVQVVGWLVQNDQVRSLPGTSSQDQLNLLTTRQTSNSGVGHQFSIQSQHGAVGLDLLSGQWSELTGSQSLLHINLSNHLGVRLNDFTSWQPSVVNRHHWNPSLRLHTDVLTQQERTLVLVSVLELPSSVDSLNSSWCTLDLEDLVHGLLIVLVDLSGSSVHGLSVLTSLESPLDVLGWSLVQVRVDVGESVLLDVSNTTVLVHVNFTSSWEQLTSQNVNQSGLTSTVWTNDSNSGRQGTLESDVRDLWLNSTWVLERHVRNLDNSLLFGLDTLQETWFWELELNLGSRQLLVRLSRWNSLDQLSKVTLVLSELETFVVDDVLNNVVQETRVVGNNDGGNVTGGQVVDQPSDIDGIQVVSWLIQKQDVSVLQHSSGKGQLHLPTTRKSSNWHVNHLFTETKLQQLGSNRVSVEISTTLLQNVVNDWGLGVRTVNVVLDVDSSTFVLSWEALNLTVGNSLHQGRLTGTVRTTQTVSSSSLQSQLSLVQKDLSTVSQRELTVTKVFTFVILVLEDRRLWNVIDGSLSELLNKLFGLLLVQEDGQEWSQRRRPRFRVDLSFVDQVTSNGSDVGLHNVESSWLTLDQVLQNRKVDLDVTGSGNLWDSVVSWDSTDSSKSVQSSLGNRSSFWVGDGRHVSLQSREKLLHERSNDLRVIDQLTHVIDDDSGFSLDGGVSLGQTSGKQRNHDGQSSGGDLRNESSSTQNVDGFWDLGWVRDRANKLWNERLNILVLNSSSSLGHSLSSSLLDVNLGIPHGLGQDWDKLRHSEGELSLGGLNQHSNSTQESDLLLPFSSLVQVLQQLLQDVLDSDWSNGLGNSNQSLASSISDLLLLVTSLGGDHINKSNNVWLNRRRQVGSTSNVRHSGKGVDSLFLVLDGLFQSLEKFVRNIMFDDFTIEERGHISSSELVKSLDRKAIFEEFPDVIPLDATTGESSTSSTADSSVDTSVFKGHDEEQIKLMDENCIVLDYDDNAIGAGTKKLCHLMTNINKGLLHRAFSVFLFNSKNELLLQQRADEKITFPSMWTNTCCSHPLCVRSELGSDLESSVKGAKNAAQRKLDHELGINPKDVPVSNFQFLTRIHYMSPSDGAWGEHEIDYILIIKADPTFEANPNEVKDTKYVSAQQLKEMFKDPSLVFTPWFKLICESYLFKWWDHLDELDQYTSSEIDRML